jgi:quercetin dioxygenase-like cupin family protein
LLAVPSGGDRTNRRSSARGRNPAILYFVKGEASVGLGDDAHEAQAGTWVYLPANLKHSIKAKTPVVMLPVLLK